VVYGILVAVPVPVVKEDKDVAELISTTKLPALYISMAGLVELSFKFVVPNIVGLTPHPAILPAVVAIIFVAVISPVIVAVVAFKTPAAETENAVPKPIPSVPT